MDVPPNGDFCSDSWTAYAILGSSALQFALGDSSVAVAAVPLTPRPTPQPHTVCGVASAKLALAYQSVCALHTVMMFSQRFAFLSLVICISAHMYALCEHTTTTTTTRR